MSFVFETTSKDINSGFEAFKKVMLEDCQEEIKALELTEQQANDFILQLYLLSGTIIRDYIAPKYFKK